MSENKNALNSLSWYHQNKHKIIINKEKRRLNQKAWYAKNREKILLNRKQNYVPAYVRRIENINADKSSKIFYIKRSDIIGH